MMPQELDPVLILVMVLPMLVAGCVDGSDSNSTDAPASDLDSPVTPPHLGPVAAAPDIPIIVNRSASGSLTLELTFDGDCPVPRTDDVLQIFVYSADGGEYATDHYITLPRDRFSVEIPLDGPSPHFVGGASPFCTRTSELRGQLEWWRFHRPGALMSVIDERRVAVPIGSSNAVESFHFPERVWNFVIAGPTEREGDGLGSISLVDPSGNTTRKTTYSIMGADDKMDRFFVWDGAYEIRVSLDAPATRETVWSYSFQYLVVPEMLCDHGFHFPDC